MTVASRRNNPARCRRLQPTSRVIRFERACDALRGPGPPSLARVAAEHGYVDQAHLSRDFRDLGGITATAWLAERPDVAAADAPDGPTVATRPQRRS